MGQSCCSHIIENSIDALLDDVIGKTSLLSLSFFQYELIFSKILKDFEDECSDEKEHEKDHKYMQLIREVFLSEEYDNIKEVSANLFFNYHTTFLNAGLRQRSIISEKNMLGNCKPTGLFLLGVLGLTNDLNKSQLIMDICLILQFKLEVGSFEDLLRVYLYKSICNLYEQAYLLCSQNINNNLLGYYIDDEFLNAALDTKIKMNELVQELIKSLYYDSFLKICLSHFQTESPEFSDLTYEEIQDRKLSAIVLDSFISQNTWLFCLKKLREHIKEIIQNKEKNIEFGEAQTESKDQ